MSRPRLLACLGLSVLTALVVSGIAPYDRATRLMEVAPGAEAPGPSDREAHRPGNGRDITGRRVSLRGEAERSRERRPQPTRRHPSELDLVAAHEGRERARGARDSRDRLVLIEALRAPGRRSGRGEP